MNAYIIGKHITEARKARELSQGQLADMLSLSPQAVSKWERGEALPDILMMKTLSEIFDRPLEWFLTGGIEEEEKEARQGKEEVFDFKIRHAEDEPQEPSQKSKREEEEKEEAPKTRDAGVRFDMSFSDWRNADFSGMVNPEGKMGYSNISNCLFRESNFAGASIKGNSIENCDFSNSDFLGASVKGNSITKSGKFAGCNFSGSQWSGDAVKNCDFSNSDFSDSKLKGCNFKQCEFDHTAFRQAELSGTVFIKCNFESDFENVSIKMGNFKKCVFKNMTFKNVFIKNSSFEHAIFENCRADRISYSFLASSRADMQHILKTID